MKTQSNPSEKIETRNVRNQILGLYIIFITALMVTYSIVTASQVL
ncbi:hypothetical protein ACFQO1_07730 [Jejudonia soesokkakensis]|uniref:Uncharacterized protein n=1 Tax=Jejudonia soesokkakensis TaxID=1323432 RepID=A0ABW2MVM3_9FLAO